MFGMPRKIKRIMEPDASSRLTVGSIAGENKRYALAEEDDGSLTLTPTDQRTVEVDARGRIPLTGLVEPGELYEVKRNLDGTITVTPVRLTPLVGMRIKVRGEYVQIPKQEEQP